LVKIELEKVIQLKNGQTLNKYLIKEDLHETSKHMNRCAMSSVIREM
jgi:hypothetical protein